MKKIIIILMLVLMSVSVHAACTNPERFVYGRNFFCKGIYEMPDGIKITSDSTYLNCDGAVIKGDGTGNGITLRSYDKVEIINCIIEGFENGIYISNANDGIVHNNTFIDNQVGIYYSNSNTSQKSNIMDNVQNIFYADAEQPAMEETSVMVEPEPAMIAEPEPIAEPTPISEPVPTPIAEPTPEPIAAPEPIDEPEDVEEPKSKLYLYLIAAIAAVVILYFIFRKKEPELTHI